jgi:hypothetical protein
MLAKCLRLPEEQKNDFPDAETLAEAIQHLK